MQTPCFYRGFVRSDVWCGVTLSALSTPDGWGRMKTRKCAQAGEPENNSGREQPHTQTATAGGNQPFAFDLIRINKSKEAVDVCSNTIRAYAKLGLRLYRCGKATFFSRSEFAAFIIGGTSR